MGRDHPPPSSTPGQTATNRIEISAARNEYEPFQVVLRPEVALTNVQVTISDFLLEPPDGGNRISATNVEVCLVGYVPVTLPSDYFGTLGEHPDPLVPLNGGVDLPAGKNQPFWFTVYVPKGAVPGNYSGSVQMQSGETSFSIPVHLRVHSFALPDVSHTFSAYNMQIDPY